MTSGPKAGAGPNPYAPPEAQVSVGEPSASLDNLVPATFGPRAIAHFIDWLVVMAVAVISGMVGGVAIAALAASGVLDPGWRTKLGATSATGFVLALVGTTLYHAVSEGIGGASVGKVLLGLRVRSDNGSPPTLGKGLLRSLAIFLDGFFFGAVAYGSMSNSPMQQRLGDKWARTIVVQASSLSPSAARPNVAMGILLGCLAQTAVTALDLLLKVL